MEPKRVYYALMRALEDYDRGKFVLVQKYVDSVNVMSMSVWYQATI